MIKILNKNVADKIAAGEVVDRPVSIVKELVENSIDSGASTITVEIREGGKSYIRVTDNGCGIDAEEVETAFLRHATSKITAVTDLDAIHTLGFRGEALASISAVSRVEMITKTKDARAGRRIIVEASKVLDNSSAGCPDGTTITVKDLFFNVPARLKFMKTDATESRQIADLMSRVALAYPDIKFRFLNGGKLVFNTTGNNNILENIINIYGQDIGKELVKVERSEKGNHVVGFVSNPGFSTASRIRQIFCVNGRVVSSPVIERALDKAYKERLFQGRFPAAFLFIAVPAETLDVNIHPTKKEIRFDDESVVEDFITDAVKEALTYKEAIPEIKGGNLKQENKANRPLSRPVTLSAEPEETKPVVPEAKPIKEEQYDIKSLLSTIREEAVAPVVREEEFHAQPSKPFDFDDLTIIGSLFDTYILAFAGDSFFMLDQHAAHERIFYEKLKGQYESKEKASQQLMIPLNFNVSADVVMTEDKWLPVIENMGYNAEFFGNNTYLVREIPAFMEMREAEDFLNDLFNQFSDRPDMQNQAVLDKIIMRSCKSAVKGGDKLTASEIDSLIEQLKRCDNPFSCPHGRPTFVKMTKYEIEKMFKRV
ncbi:MAG: DNA mismatch repair endonuclease MutL [Firmicutes bacterium]|nr:DNA mismatch repair endonuclease MutL [Bacillota bacterium]